MLEKFIGTHKDTRAMSGHFSSVLMSTLNKYFTTVLLSHPLLGLLKYLFDMNNFDLSFRLVD